MAATLRKIITSTDKDTRDRPLEGACADLGIDGLLTEAEDLERFRQESDNLYERVRALFFLYAIHRFELPRREALNRRGLLPYEGYLHLLKRRFEEAIEVFRAAEAAHGPSDALSSALAAAYHELGFQTLADQVRRSVRSVRGNQWMFRLGHPADHPLRIRPEMLRRDPEGKGLYPVLRERTPVRMDLSHSGWSDIFFLGMDYPEGARVLNVSINLGVHGRDAEPQPPIEAYLRVIDEPILRLTSVDLEATADIEDLDEVFDFARDYLGLLKAAVIAAGVVPPGIEGSGQKLADLLERLVGQGLGLELISCVNGIPKGSRLAVSTNLLAALITVLMRATGQTKALTGLLEESERRITAARAILGEWLGGSGGGWQDSGGVWPGIKLIEGVSATEGDPEFGISRGRLLPSHRILDENNVPEKTREELQRSLVLVHGGMAQNVGPILEMVTEKYLLRSSREWKARQHSLEIFDRILEDLHRGDIAALGDATTRHFEGPIQAVIPWASNAYTERLISEAKEGLGAGFRGFWMLGGMSGGGMGFMVAPESQAKARELLAEKMGAAKAELEHALPFAMDPVVYDFSINENGTIADRIGNDEAPLPAGYYSLWVPRLLRVNPRDLSPARRLELELFGNACRTQTKLADLASHLFEGLLPAGEREETGTKSLETLLMENGFDETQHEQIRAALQAGRIGLSQNRLAENTVIEDVCEEDVWDSSRDITNADKKAGKVALSRGEVAVLSLAAGAGSRWTQGAGVVKAINPFCLLGGKHRTFLEVHVAKSRRRGRQAGCLPPHLVSTSFLTQEAIAQHLDHVGNYGYEGDLLLSPGRSIGLRMIPCVRDLHFAWEEMPQQLLDEQKQKVLESLHAALISWARNAGEAGDYTDNIPPQCLHPVGHWFEAPNMLRNGVLRHLLSERPQLRHLMLHNIDTLGADLDPGLLGLHIRGEAALTFEVITRRIEDRGGGLARIDGRVRLVEGLAMPREEDEFALSYYNSMTTWIDIDRLLDIFGLSRKDLADEQKVSEAVRDVGGRLPTYVTLKDVKKRWGHGQEDVFPVSQFEKLWSDMSALSDVDCRFVVVPRLRGQQLKEPAQLDGWLRDGSAAHVESLCDWG